MIINILCGHALYGAVGARGIEGIKEESLTRQFARTLETQLVSKGHKVNIIRIDEESSSYKELTRKVSIANSSKVELNISIHFNAYNLATANGVEIYTYSGQSIYNASKMLSELRKLGFKDRGVKCGAHLKVINSTIAKTMLVEFGFITSPKDFELIRKLGAERMCRAISDTFPDVNPKSEIEILRIENAELKDKLRKIEVLSKC